MVNEAQVVPPVVVNARPEQLQAHQTAVTAWKTMNAQAGGLIHSMCEEIPADKIEDLPTATERWIKLKVDYTSSGFRFVNRFTKLEDLWHLRPSGSENSIETYVANIRSKAKELKEMGSPIEEWIVVSILLSNLDIKYKDFKHRLLTSALEKNPSFEQVIHLVHEEEERLLLKRENKDQAALATASNSKGKGQNNRGNSSKNSNGKVKGEYQ